MNSSIQNTRYKIQDTKLKGFTLIESLVFLFIFALIGVVFFQVYATGTRMIIESKNRLGATALANQKMEIIRSIAYDDIGTKRWNGSAWLYGIPGGELLEDETISVNTVRYDVHTFVQYVDDSFDGTIGGSPNDTVSTDYKRVRLTVEWGGGGDDQKVVIFGNFSPNGVETSGGGGTLSINVLDATGSGVSGASVRIVNSGASIDTTATTDSTGNVMLPGAPAGVEAYTLTVSKGGYYGATTYASYPTSAYNPVDVHASVVEATLNQKTIVMDQNVDIPLRTKDPFGTDVPDIGFTLSGGRVLGTDAGTGANVYGFSDTSTTDSSGEKTYSDQSYGQYTLTVSDADYEFYKMHPETSSTADVMDLVPGSSGTMEAILLDKNIGSVKVTVKSSADDSPVSGASVRLTNTSVPYDATVTTDQYGIAYFPTSLPALVNGSYDVEVTASGFGTETKTVGVGSALVTENIQMTPN